MMEIYISKLNFRLLCLIIFSSNDINTIITAN